MVRSLFKTNIESNPIAPATLKYAGLQPLGNPVQCPTWEGYCIVSAGINPNIPPILHQSHHQQWKLSADLQESTETIERERLMLRIQNSVPADICCGTIANLKITRLNWNSLLDTSTPPDLICENPLFAIFCVTDCIYEPDYLFISRYEPVYAACYYCIRKQLPHLWGFNILLS